MKKTVGGTDSIIRIVLGVAIGYFAYTTFFESFWIQIALYVISIVLLITSITGLCPLYSIFKINTCKLKK